VLFYAQKSAKTTWISKSNRSLERVQKQKTGSDFPLNRFPVCVNVFLWAKMQPKFFGQYRTILDFFNAGWRQLCNTLK